MKKTTPAPAPPPRSALHAATAEPEPGIGAGVAALIYFALALLYFLPAFLPGRHIFGHLTRRLGELSKIDLSEIPADRIGFGSRVTVVDLRTREEETYTLVFGDYIDVDSGQISVASPLGQALIGKQKGEKVSLQLPRGERKLHVKEVVTLPQMVENPDDAA
jgi:GreA/GreB family transcription elongation factor